MFNVKRKWNVVKTALTVLLGLLLVTNASGFDQPTISFDPSEATVGSNASVIEYTDAHRVTVGMELSLPCFEYLLELNDGESLSLIESQAAGLSAIGQVERSLLHDAPTSENNEYGLLPALPSTEFRLGFSTVHVTGRINLNDQHFAQLLVFPITVDADGVLWFNQSVAIKIDGAEVDPSTLVLRESVLKDAGTQRSSVAANAASGALEYVIVTSGELADALAPLATYKNETGYVTEIKLIGDILPLYSGCDDAEKLREYLKEFHASGGQYVLLAGDETVLPIRHVYHYDADTTPDLTYLQLCDLYFADLTGDWDTDNDGIWGERYHDQPDLTPELRVGRLPINRPEEATNYVNKLIAYETNPGGDDPGYLESAFFFSSDQMRDYSSAGQHNLIAQAYPDHFAIDTASGVEMSSGGDLQPTNLPINELQQVVSEGYGIVNIIAHGASNGFCTKTSGYNNWPKEFFGTGVDEDGLGFVHLEPNSKISFYYSLACSNGGFDRDQPPFYETGHNLAQALIAQDNAGAVGFVAYSRWGWISSSHKLQKAFFDSLFANPESPAIDAMYASKEAYYYYRDLVYGQNYFGDPTLKVYTRVPDSLHLDVMMSSSDLDVSVNCNGEPARNCEVILSHDGQILAEAVTDASGHAVIDYTLDSLEIYRISTTRTNATVSQVLMVQSTVTSVDPDEVSLPLGFVLHQNYPNPFNPSTVISFDLPEPSNVLLTVFNVLGQTVATPVNGSITAGPHTVEWDGRNTNGSAVAGGVYFYRLITDGFSDVKKMILLK
ncbi:MAG: hypothetical protein DRP45_03270 [Candidatus Zixiibacteriota bacterium]|nr:MAG: hypothetical protein DRP45_03270 [candidate division Zixibacteria bacterium]